MKERKKFEIFCTCSSCGKTSLAHGVLQLLPSAAEARRWWEENRERMCRDTRTSAPACALSV